MRRPSSANEVEYVDNFQEFKQQFHLKNQIAFQVCQMRHETQNLIKQKKNYDQIKQSWKFFDVGKKKVGNLDNARQVKDKVVLKRKVINDYISIVNKRGEIIEGINSDFQEMIDIHDDAIFYYNKYYNNKSLDHISKLFNQLSPQFKYNLNSIQKSAKKLKRMVENSGRVLRDKRKQELARLREEERMKELQAIEKSKQNQWWYLQEEEEKKQGRGPGGKKGKGMQDDRVTHIKGYMDLEQDLGDAKKDILVLQEVQKFGSDRIKQKVFIKDMKEILDKMKEEEAEKKKQEDGAQTSAHSPSPHKHKSRTDLNPLSPTDAKTLPSQAALTPHADGTKPALTPHAEDREGAGERLGGAEEHGQANARAQLQPPSLANIRIHKSLESIQSLSHDASGASRSDQSDDESNSGSSSSISGKGNSLRNLDRNKLGLKQARSANDSLACQPGDAQPAQDRPVVTLVPPGKSEAAAGWHQHQHQLSSPSVKSELVVTSASHQRQGSLNEPELAKKWSHQSYLSPITTPDSLPDGHRVSVLARKSAVYPGMALTPNSALIRARALPRLSKIYTPILSQQLQQQLVTQTGDGAGQPAGDARLSLQQPPPQQSTPTLAQKKDSLRKRSHFHTSQDNLDQIQQDLLVQEMEILTLNQQAANYVEAMEKQKQEKEEEDDIQEQKIREFQKKREELLQKAQQSKQYIEKYYNQRMLGMKKEATPLYNAQQLQAIMKKQQRPNKFEKVKSKLKSQIQLIFL